MNNKYETIIGLEIHAQLKTDSKIFCACSTKFGNEPNTNICPVCTGQPGVLPVLNQRAVEMLIKTGIALNCEIHDKSVFARKNYFYPDLPKDYQISQYKLPLATEGKIEIIVNGEVRKIGITRVHLEEDAGKLVHVGSDRIQGSKESLVDLNRTGVPLMEIVSEPDIRSPEEAKVYVGELRAILIHLGVCDGNMEEGSLRCDANVSLRPVGQKEFGTKTEVKNMNSFRTILRALEAEIERQTKALEAGEKIIQETRHFDEKTGRTISLRSKEEAHDYRYFPEPDLVPIDISAEMLSFAKASIGELPQQRKERYRKDLGIKAEDADTIISSICLLSFFEETCSQHKALAQECANWLTGDISAYLKANNLEISQTKLTPANLVNLILLIQKGTISGKIAKEIIIEMLRNGKPAEEIVKTSGKTQISDEAELQDIILEVIKNNPGPAAQYKSGKTGTISFLVGQVMKATGGRANPQTVNELLRKELT
jgi:aspartyl-tRNA(Asn)/glutamyl-tRNA(Gln) amidotransferase subunit B